MTPPRSPSARHRGLTRDQVVRAALEIADRDGLDGLSMRRLGVALGRSPMALYYYVSDRDDLLRGIHELLNDEVRSPTAQDWRGYAEQCAWGFFQLAQAHPKVVPTVIASPTPAGPSPIVGHISGLLDRLVAAGVSPAAAQLVVTTIWDFATGAIISQLVGRPALGTAPIDPEAEFRAGLAIVLDGVAAGSLPDQAARVEDVEDVAD